MPKIINNLQETILRESRRLLLDYGYKEMSIRKIASVCGIAVGTIYNYYSNKDMIIAQIMVEDWRKTMAEVDVCCENAKTLNEAVTELYGTFRVFTEQYESLFRDYYGSSTILELHGKNHIKLRNQLESRLSRLLTRFGYANDPLITITAEALITLTLQDGFPKEEVSAFIARLYPEK